MSAVHATGRHAARGLGIIGLCAAGFTALAILLPAPAGFDRVGVLLVCVATALASLVMFLPWWQRLGVRATLVMVPVALVLISVHNLLGAVDPFRYGVFYLLLFVWIGMYHPPRTALLAGIPTLVSYGVPLMASGDHVALATAVYAVPMYVVVGELLARRSSALGQAQERLHVLAHSDALTGLPNRRAFLDHVRAAQAGSDGPPAVAFLDLDGFKAVNDRLGHASGDALLQAVAEAITSVCRAGDLAARLAGDEFAVLLSAPISPSEAAAVGDRLRGAISAAAERVAPGLGVGVSVGIARSEGGPDEVLAGADAAMYRAKRNRLGVVLADSLRITAV
jgi:diguanylate cyclase (GGDEF)-like protein